MIDPRYMFGEVLGRRYSVLGSWSGNDLKIAILAVWVPLCLGFVWFSMAANTGSNCVLVKEAPIEIGQLSQMVDSYYLASSPRRYPSELSDLTEGPSPLTKEVPKDPWGNSYVYARYSDTKYEIWSVGPDGINHTEDDVHGGVE